MTSGRVSCVSVYHTLRSRRSPTIRRSTSSGENFQTTLEPLRERLNTARDESREEGEIPRDAELDWSEEAKETHAEWWKQRIARQSEIDASIAAKADFEYLHDRPYEDKNKVRVAGPFTVESMSPHRMLGVGADDELIDEVAAAQAASGESRDFVSMVLENLKTSGVQQAHKEDKIILHSVTPWPGNFVCADGQYSEVGDGSSVEKRAAIFVGPEFGQSPVRIWCRPPARLGKPTSMC